MIDSDSLLFGARIGLVFTGVALRKDFPTHNNLAASYRLPGNDFDGAWQAAVANGVAHVIGSS